MNDARKRAIQEVRDFYPTQLRGSGDEFVAGQLPGMVMFAERAIRAERKLDEAVRLLRTMWEEGTLPEDMEHDVAALVAAPKGESNGE